MAVVAAILLAGCIDRETCYGSYCDGTVLHFCAIEEDRSEARERDCADNGQICLATTTAVECVFPDRPCTGWSCAGSEVVVCGLNGFVVSHASCSSPDEPNRTCIELADQSTICGYPSAPCTDPASDGVCSADGQIVYSGCTELGYREYPRYARTCPTGTVCATGNGTADCVDPARIP
jgi:hypothetical protein